LENLKTAVQFRLISLILTIAVYLPVWHCTRRRFAVLVSWSVELAVHSRSLLRLQMQVAKLVSGLFDRYSLLRNNNMATNLQRFSYGRRRFVACDCRTQGRIKGRGGPTGTIAPGPPLQRDPPRWNLFVSNKIFVWKVSWFRSDTRIQLYIILLYVALSFKSPQQQLNSLQVWLSASF